MSLTVTIGTGFKLTVPILSYSHVSVGVDNEVDCLGDFAMSEPEGALQLDVVTAVVLRLSTNSGSITEERTL